MSAPKKSSPRGARQHPLHSPERMGLEEVMLMKRAWGVDSFLSVEELMRLAAKISRTAGCGRDLFLALAEGVAEQNLEPGANVPDSWVWLAGLPAKKRRASTTK